MIIPLGVDFLKYVDALSVLESQEIHWGNHWRTSLLDRLQNGITHEGMPLPWSKTEDLFRLRPGELTLWAGINGHKKSMLLGQVMLWVARHERVCIASLEMRPETTLLRMAQQAAGCYPSPEFTHQFLDWSNERICIYDQLDQVDIKRILGMVHYAAQELHCTHVVIDSLTKCGLSDDDYSGQKYFIDRLQWAAKHYAIHIHLVCHIRKGIDEYRMPNKFDIKGSGALTDLADNVVIVWKNKAREEALLKLKENRPLTDSEAKTQDQADQVIIVEKQRDAEWEGRFSLWFHSGSLQFTPGSNNRVMPFELGSCLK